MIEVINYKEIPSFTRIPVETICKCDNCKKIIARKKERETIDQDKSRITLKEYEDINRKFFNDNPISVTYYKIGEALGKALPSDYCEECLMEGVNYMLKLYDEINVEKIKDNCFYTEVGDKSDGFNTGEEK